MRILLLEPDYHLAKIYQTALQDAGYTVEHCRTGQEGIMAADHHQPDVAILELQLARHNGIEFLYEFRSYPEWQKVPIIVNSMVPLTETGMTPLLTRFDIIAYHYKPLTKLRDLLATIERFVPTAA